jgi:pilus assembly protein CpaB
MTRRILIGFLAIVLAAVGTGAVLAYAHGADRRALAGQQAVNAYIVRKDVPAGTTVSKAVDDGLIVRELVARKGVPEGALTQVDSGTEGLVATTELAPGQVVLKSVFGSQAAVPGRLAVPTGKMAVSVALDDASHVGSFLTVGSHIAVFDTFNIQEKRAGLTPAGDHIQDQHIYARATRVLAPDLLVLAIDDTTVAPSGKNSSDGQNSSDMQNASADSTTTALITLAVTQDQAQRLIHGARTGTMTFALLGSNAVPAPGTGVDDSNLFTGVKP